MTRNTASVVILDGERPASLAAVRSLGRRGVRVVVGSGRPGVIAARSRYTSRSFVYPDPRLSPREFRRTVLGVIQNEGGVALTIPVGDGACAALAAGRAEFDGHSRLALAPDGALAAALSRSGTRAVAGRLGIPAAVSVEVRSVSAGLSAAADIGFPVIVAPDSSVSRAAAGPAGGAQYATDQVTLVRRLTPILKWGAGHVGRPPEGEGIGLAVLCRRGSVLWAFQYRRLHEVEPGDAVSAARVSERADPALLAYAQSLMRDLSWDGAAELQFRRHGGEFRLTKIGATLAEATPVAVAAGADAPGFLYDLELDDRREFRDGYRVGVRCQHLPSELTWLREAVWPRTPASASVGRPNRARVLAEVARALNPRTRWDTQSISDVRPGAQEVREVSAGVWESLTWRLARAWQRRRMRRAARSPGELARRIAEARTIVFVCFGNIIRSAFAAELLRARSAGRLESKLRISSAGLDAATDHPADPTAVQRARRFGVDLSTHRTRRVDGSAVAEADVLLAMEIDHVVEICRRFPRYRDRVYLFGCLTDADVTDVADPVYAPEELFDACFDRIDRGVRRIVELRYPVAAAVASTSGIRA